MGFSVFISHSVGGTENSIVDSLSASLTGAGIHSYLAGHDRQPGLRLAPKVQSHISESGTLIALLTKRGEESSWVHDEIGFALGLGRKVVAFVEKGLKLEGMHDGAEYASFDPKAPEESISLLSAIFARRKAEEQAAWADAAVADAENRAASAGFWAIVALFIAALAIILLVLFHAG